MDGVKTRVNRDTLVSLVQEKNTARLTDLTN
jgi:hypothetical protein